MTKVQSDETKISIIQNDITYIKTDISDIKNVLKEGYATKESLLEVAKTTERRLTALEKAVGVTKYLFPIVSAIAASVATFLIIHYLQHL